MSELLMVEVDDDIEICQILNVSSDGTADIKLARPGSSTPFVNTKVSILNVIDTTARETGVSADEITQWLNTRENNND